LEFIYSTSDCQFETLLTRYLSKNTPHTIPRKIAASTK